MFNKFAAGLLLGACVISSALANTPVSDDWLTVGNNVSIKSTAGCIDNNTMYVRHQISAKPGQEYVWRNSLDYDVTFSLFDRNQPSPELRARRPVHHFSTSQLHRTNNSLLDEDGNQMQVIIYTIRPYEPLTSYAEKDHLAPYNTIGPLQLDPKCHTAAFY